MKYSRTKKFLALFTAFTFLSQIISPTIAWALTSGPSQPEVQSFEPIGTSDMVDLFSGDYNYNIPLLDVGGYPVNISYHGGITMDQEASWVGLGWNINPGVINRSMRGVPDDFNGDHIEKHFNVKANNTFGANLSGAFELFGIKLPVTFGVGLRYNNYVGFGFDMSVSPTINGGDKAKGPCSASLGLSAGSESGVGITANVNFSKTANSKDGGSRKIQGSVGLGFNSRSGLQALSLGLKVNRTDTKIVTDAQGNQSSTMVKTEHNGGSSISFATPTYTPQINMEMLNTSISLGGTFGAAIFGAHPDMCLTAYYSGQYLLSREKDVPAYGYLYAENGSDRDKAIMDFNREKDGAFTENTPNLPLTNFTYDVYSVTGQGIGGMYRPFRSEVGAVFDDAAQNHGGGFNLSGIELGAGNTAHGGLNFDVNYTNSKSGKWKEDNSAYDKLKFHSKEWTNDILYEPFYMKQAGEKNTDNYPELFASIGSYEPVRIALNSGPESVPAMSTFIDKNESTTYPITTNNYRKKRQPRNESVSILTRHEVDELISAGYSGRQMKSYDDNTFDMSSGEFTSQAANAPANTGDHTGLISAVRADGMRYVYGVTAYNKSQTERSFAINSGGSADLSTGLVPFSSGSEDTDNNGSGDDHFFSSTDLPPFSHSYLLTEVLSSDYVDLTGDGPSTDDLGNYTKINYTKVSENCNWRVPFAQANYDETLHSKTDDDKANYVYGTKEVWYVHSIETKTHVAEFHLNNKVDDPRHDSFSPSGTAGGMGAQDMRMLKEIYLYSREDKTINGSNAIPVKVVHFEYDYSLCNGIPNSDNGKGKLTLKKVYFTYGKSFKAKLSPYTFEYGQFTETGGNVTIINPSYNLKGYDRWGNYKKNLATSSYSGSVLSTSEYPYVEQNDRQEANRNATAWSLTTIKLPSGGEIKVNLEADDYAYVQDQVAGQMFKIIGAGDNSNPNNSELHNGTLFDNNINGNAENTYLYFNLSKDASGNFVTAENKYLEGIGKLYFRFLINITNGNISNWQDGEYVSGYCNIDRGSPSYFGTFVDPGNSSNMCGWVRVKKEDLSESAGMQINPISRAAWNFAKLYLPRKAFGQSDPNDPGLLQILESIAAAFKAIQQLITGFNRDLKFRWFGRDFNTAKSWVRLNNPNGYKVGGGARVKRITINDNFLTMTGNAAYDNFSYGQDYDYTTKNAYGETISSGVASYEPMVGGDEISLRQPKAFKDKHMLAPDDEHYMETPFGESFFPSPGVGYSKVTVSNIKHNGVNRNATGKVVNEFYTAYDFPTKVKQTIIKAHRKRPNPLFRLFKIKGTDYLTASQGYSIETNDMHGKQKAQWVYQEGNDAPISGVEHFYKTKVESTYIPALNKNLNVTVLDNEVDVLNKNITSTNPVIEKRIVGVDYDFVTDFRQEFTKTYSGGLRGNLDAFLAAILPVAIPIVLPALSSEKVRFRSASTTKVINRYGLIDHVVAHDLGSIVSTKNVLYDAMSGEVLLTETANQFDDPVFNFTYPAHLGYNGMGPAFKNVSLEIGSASIANGILSQSGAPAYFVKGDEVLLGSGSPVYAWVTDVTPSTVEIKDQHGNLVNGTYKLKIVRSGRKNVHNTPIGSVASLKTPISGNTIAYNASTQIINASSVEFSDEWKKFCECENAIDEPGNGNTRGGNPNTPLSGALTANPYADGTRGNWRQKKSHLFLTERSQSRLNNNTNVRHDGIYLAFHPFWNIPGNSYDDWSIDYNNWTWTSEVTEFSPFGFELENRDALNRYSAAVYGYYDRLPTGVSSNSKYREIGFDSFEDYNMGNCDKDHFSFRLHDKAKVTNQDAHAGRRSIKVAIGQSASVTKILKPCK